MCRIFQFLVFFLLVKGSYAQSIVTLSGHIQNAGNVINVEDFSEFQYLHRSGSGNAITPDEKGNFSITFSLDAPNYFRVGRSKLYLSPGDHINCEIDGKNENLAKFSGVGSAACNYLVGSPFPKAGSYLEATRYIYQSPIMTMDSIIIRSANRKRRLQNLTDVSDEFKRLEMARINADVRISFNALATYLPLFNAYAREFNQDYFNVIQAISSPFMKDYMLPVDASCLKVEPYRDLAMSLVPGLPESDEVKKIKDWMKVSNIIKAMDGINDKKDLKHFEDELQTIHTNAYRHAAEVYKKQIENYGKGDLAVDIICLDLDLKRIALSALRGKVIYIDIWATWCGPCLAEMPAYNALKEKYKDNKNIAFVSLSIDDESKLKEWQKNIEDRKANGLQWEINRNKLSAYNITGIPRAIIIDRNFRIANMNAPLPSSKQLQAELDNLIKI